MERWLQREMAECAAGRSEKKLACLRRRFWRNGGPGGAQEAERQKQVLWAGEMKGIQDTQREVASGMGRAA